VFDLFERPDVELAFLAFRIGIERRREAALGRGHLSSEPADRLGRAFAKQRIFDSRIIER
jgi:hypothetical protein